MTLTPRTLNPASASEEVWKVHELPALFSWTYFALVAVKRNGIYTFLHRGTEKRVTVAPLQQRSELRVRKTNLGIFGRNFRRVTHQWPCHAPRDTYGWWSIFSKILIIVKVFFYILTGILISDKFYIRRLIITLVVTPTEVHLRWRSIFCKIGGQFFVK